MVFLEAHGQSPTVPANVFSEVLLARAKIALLSDVEQVMGRMLAMAMPLKLTHFKLYSGDPPEDDEENTARLVKRWTIHQGCPIEEV